MFKLAVGLALATALFALESVSMAQTPRIQAQATSVWLITAGRVFDARSEATHAGWAVLVEGGKITAVAPWDHIHPSVGANNDLLIFNIPVY